MHFSLKNSSTATQFRRGISANFFLESFSEDDFDSCILHFSHEIKLVLQFFRPEVHYYVHH